MQLSELGIPLMRVVADHPSCTAKFHPSLAKPAPSSIHIMGLKHGLNLDTPAESQKDRMSLENPHGFPPHPTKTSNPQIFQDQRSRVTSRGGISGGDGLCETLGGSAGRLWRQDHRGGLRGLGKHLEGALGGVFYEVMRTAKPRFWWLWLSWFIEVYSKVTDWECDGVRIIPSHHALNVWRLYEHLIPRCSKYLRSVCIAGWIIAIHVVVFSRPTRSLAYVPKVELLVGDQGIRKNRIQLKLVLKNGFVQTSTMDVPANSWQFSWSNS